MHLTGFHFVFLFASSHAQRLELLLCLHFYCQMLAVSTALLWQCRLGSVIEWPACASGIKLFDILVVLAWIDLSLFPEGIRLHCVAVSRFNVLTVLDQFHSSCPRVCTKNM